MLKAVELKKAKQKEKRLQKRALKKQLKLERGIKLKKDELEREIKYGALTLERQERNWRKLMIDISLSHVRDGFQYTWTVFDRTLDFKDFIISMLMDELRCVEEQYIHNFNNHLEKCERLICLFGDTMQELHENYFVTITNLRKGQLQNDLNDGQNTTKNEDYLKTMLYKIEILEKARCKQTYIENACNFTEMYDKYDYLLTTLRVHLENKLENLWAKTKQTITDFLKKKREYINRHDKLTSIDNAVQETLKNHLKKMAYLHEIIQKFKAKHANLEDTSGRVLQNIINEKQTLGATFFALKNKFFAESKSDAQKQYMMTLECTGVLDYLESLERKGTKIIRQMEYCRRSETLREKLMPFSIGEGDVRMSLKGLQNVSMLFCQKVARADASRVGIYEKRTLLQAYNRSLNRQIMEWCECISCPKLPPIEKSKRSGQIPVTECSLMIKSQKRHSKKFNYNY